MHLSLAPHEPVPASKCTASKNYSVAMQGGKGRECTSMMLTSVESTRKALRGRPARNFFKRARLFSVGDALFSCFATYAKLFELSLLIRKRPVWLLACTPAGRSLSGSFLNFKKQEIHFAPKFLKLKKQGTYGSSSTFLSSDSGCTVRHLTSASRVA